MSTSLSKSIMAISKREWNRMKMRPIYLFAPVFVMLFCSIFFLTLFSEGLPNSLPTGVVDQDCSYLSRTFIRNVDATAQTRIVKHYSDYTEAREDMQRGKIYAFIVIKPGFERDILSSRRPALTFYVNDAYLIAGSLSLKNITLMSELTSGSVLKQALEAKGTVGDKQLMALLEPIALDLHLAGNPWANYSIYLINVLIPGVLQLMILMFTIFAVGNEFKEKTSREWLQTGDNSMFAALAGKLLPYTLLFTVLGIGSNFILYRYMHFPMNGSLAWMCLATFLYVLAHQAIGILIIGIFPGLRDAISLTAFYGLLGFTYAGFTFPIEGMPYGVRIFSELFPIRHYFRIYLNEALYGIDFRYSMIWFAALAAFLVLPGLVYRRLQRVAASI